MWIALPWHHQRIESILQHLPARQLPGVEALLRCISGQLGLQILQSEATLFDLMFALDVSSGSPLLCPFKGLGGARPWSFRCKRNCSLSHGDHAHIKMEGLVDSLAESAARIKPGEGPPQ
jgi:hypothetical protein